MRDRETIFSENERMANERLGYCTQCDESASLPKEKKCGRPVRGIKHSSQKWLRRSIRGNIQKIKMLVGHPRSPMGDISK